MRVSLTLRSTSMRQTAKEERKKKGERGERLKLDYYRVKLQNKNFARHLTGKCAR